MKMFLTIVEILILATFGIAFNLAVFAVYKYRIANKLHRETRKKEYAGALPKHIWKTALGTALVLVGAVLLILVVDRLTYGHFFILVGYVLLAAGMQELLNFENHRIKTIRGVTKVQVADDCEEQT